VGSSAPFQRRDILGRTAGWIHLRDRPHRVGCVNALCYLVVAFFVVAPGRTWNLMQVTREAPTDVPRRARPDRTVRAEPPQVASPKRSLRCLPLTQYEKAAVEYKAPYFLVLVIVERTTSA